MARIFIHLWTPQILWWRIVDYRTRLNNLLAPRNQKAVYTFSNSGPQNDLTWTAAVHIDGIQHGEGSGKSKGEASELAAQQALSVLT
ncbi:hypothetical protein C8J56DRAFT_1159290 [Mycena floridula]|nr:hypothetical protein C8J56DRAFT_1159290 [Mycena floridula]